MIAVGLDLAPSPAESRLAWQQIRRAERELRPVEQAKGLEMAARWSGDRVDLLNQAAEIYLAQDLPAESIRIWAPMREQEYFTARMAYLLGRAYQKSNDVSSALWVWQTYAGQPDATWELAQAVVDGYSAQQQWREARLFLETWSDLHPDDVSAQFELAKIISLQDLLRSRDLLRELVLKESSYAARAAPLQKAIGAALEISPSARADLLLGRGLAQLGEWHLAEFVFERAAQAEPDYAEAWALLGEARQQIGQDGWQEILTAAELNPDSALVKVITGLYYRRSGDPAKALPFIVSAVEDEPEEITWKIELGLTYAESGDLVKAVDVLRSAAREAPQDIRTWKNLAWFSSTYEVELRETGLPAAREAVALDDRDGGSLDLMGIILYQLGDDVSAERFLQQAVQADPNNSAAFLHLGQLYWTTARPVEAEQALRQAAALSEEGSQIFTIADRLIRRYFGD